MKSKTIYFHFYMLLMLFCGGFHLPYANAGVTDFTPYFVCIENNSSYYLSAQEIAFVGGSNLFNPTVATQILTNSIPPKSGAPSEDFFFDPYHSYCGMLLTDDVDFNDVGIKFWLAASKTDDNGPENYTPQSGIPGVTIPYIGSAHLESGVNGPLVVSRWKQVDNVAWKCDGQGYSPGKKATCEALSLIENDSKYVSIRSFLKSLLLGGTMTKAYILSVNDAPTTTICVQNTANVNLTVTPFGEGMLPITGSVFQPDTSNNFQSAYITSPAWEDNCVQVSSDQLSTAGFNYKYKGNGDITFSVPLGDVTFPTNPPLTFQGNWLAGQWISSVYVPGLNGQGWVLKIENSPVIYSCIANNSSYDVTALVSPSTGGVYQKTPNSNSEWGNGVTINQGDATWQDYCLEVPINTDKQQGFNLLVEGSGRSKLISGYLSGATPAISINDQTEFYVTPTHLTPGDKSTQKVNLFVVKDK